MAPKPAQDKVLLLYKQGVSKEDVKKHLRDQGLSKSRVSQLTNPWPPMDSNETEADLDDDEMPQDCWLVLNN